MNSSRSVQACFVTLLALVVAGCTSIVIPVEETTIDRATVTRGGKYIGATEREVVETDAGRQIITRQTFPVKIKDTQQRTVLEEKTRLVDLNGQTTRISLVFTVGNSSTTTTAQIRDSFATVTRESRSAIKQQRVALPKNTYFDSGAELFRSWNFKEHPEMVFHTLDVRAPLIEKHIYSLVERDNGVTLKKLSYSGENLRSVTHKHYDENGQLLSSIQPMFGQDLRSGSSVSRETNDFELIDPVRSSSVKSPYRISREARNGHMRYTFGFRHGVSFAPPETAEQRVEMLDDGFVLDICQNCGPGLDNSEDYLNDAMQPTFWLESDHPELARIALKSSNKGLPDEEIMNRLEYWARLQMSEIDFAGHFSAAEALSLGRGDCTEGAVVLAALGRAAGIPTRVASGIVYSREQYHGISHSFAPHAWTLAYVDGQWKSFDMSLEYFDSTHIALNISDGDPGSILAGHRLAGLLTWEAMTQVKQREDSDER